MRRLILFLCFAGCSPCKTTIQVTPDRTSGSLNTAASRVAAIVGNVARMHQFTPADNSKHVISDLPVEYQRDVARGAECKSTLRLIARQLPDKTGVFEVTVSEPRCPAAPGESPEHAQLRRELTRWFRAEFGDASVTVKEDGLDNRP